MKLVLLILLIVCVNAEKSAFSESVQVSSSNGNQHQDSEIFKKMVKEEAEQAKANADLEKREEIYGSKPLGRYLADPILEFDERPLTKFKKSKKKKIAAACLLATSWIFMSNFI